MTETEKIFLDAYRRSLQSGRPADKGMINEDGSYCDITPAEWRRVLAIAESHCVYPMVFESIYAESDKAVLKTRFFERGLKRAEELTCNQARMSAEFLKLYQFLAKRGLEPVVMKGILCRSLYPNPEQRQSSDEDLLVAETEFAKYHKAFIDFGLELAIPDCDVERDHEVSYCNSHVYIEVHKQLFPPDSKAYGDLNRFFTNVWDRKIRTSVYGVYITSMGHTDHLFYQLCHAYKHFLSSGIGIRLVSDIVLYSMVYTDKIDWETVIERCREIRAYDFAAALYKIGQNHLFPERFPEELAALWGTDMVNEEALLLDVLKGGVLGASSENRLHSANLTLGAVENAKSGRSTSALYRTLFPSGESLKGRYPWLRKMPFLLPAAWLHRMFVYSADNVVHSRGGHSATEAFRIGNERIALMRRYHMLEERKREPNPLKRVYKWSHTSPLAPVLSPLFAFVSMAEYYGLNLIWVVKGNRLPNEADRALVRENVTFIVKSFERQHLVRGLIRNISRMYPGVRIIIADDSREPLEVKLPNVRVIRLPFNSGLSAGLCAALEEVTTPYVMRMDDDELLTVRSGVHRELRFLMGHPGLDLIGFGHTTAIRLHSPEFNFREYYKSPMNDALRPLRIPHLTKIDENHVVLGKVANIYLARTEKLREVGFDPKIRVIDHHEFFWRAAGVMTSAVALDTVVFHRHNPYERGYNAYRSDYASDLEYIRKKHRKMIQEAKKKDEE